MVHVTSAGTIRGLVGVISREVIALIRRVVVGAGIAALVIPGAFVPGSAGAEDGPADRFAPAPSSGLVDPVVTPAALDDSRRVSVMVEMDGAPVAVREARRGEELSASRDRQVQRALRSVQDRAAEAIEAEGGRVESYLQSAYNGMRATVSRSALPAIQGIAGVKAVHVIPIHELEHEVSVPFLGVPQVWEGTGFTGEGVKVAVIDTGIDYTHANFSGPGTVEAYESADTADEAPADPALFGPDAPRIKGGFDFVGDDYDAGDPTSVAVPDPNPLDCQGHGSHVAGTVGGSGVDPDGSTYEGDYDSDTFGQDFKIGPGVAPRADLYALRVFGCAGSTDVTVDAIDWAVAHDMDVINMSLGSSFGSADDPSAVASTNAVAAGVVVVTSAGNSGPAPYITGSPGTAPGAVSVAAVDPAESFPGATLTFGGTTINAINANGATLPSGGLEIVALTDDPATPANEALGCSVADYTRAGIVAGGNQLAVTQRGVCARAARGVFAQQAGAAAVVMINNTSDFPPYEGEITGNPDTGEQYRVTIPLLGVRGVVGAAPTQDGDQLLAADGQSVTLGTTTIANPAFRGFASFSSGGPRRGDSGAKPNVAAPGVSTLSTAVGTGSEGTIKSGTSMAAPHVAGVAALGVEAHPGWTSQEISSALVTTADPAKVAGYSVSRGGAGLVDTAQVVGGTTLAYGDTTEATGGTVRQPSLSFGFDESAGTFTETRTITVVNKGKRAVNYRTSAVASPQSEQADVTVTPSQVTVDPRQTATVTVRLSIPASGIPGSQSSTDQFNFSEVSGNVVLTAKRAADGVLRVPYLMVPRSLSQVDATVDGDTATLTNSGAIAGDADFYTWGVDDPAGDSGADDGVDLRAIGAQAFDFQSTKLVVFAVNTHDRYSNAAANEHDVYVDANGDGTDDFVVLSADSGSVRAGSANGTTEVFVANLRTGALSAAGFLASAPTDSGTVLLPVRASSLGMTEASPAFSYAGASFGRDGGLDTTDSASYDPWSPSFASDGRFVTVAPGGSQQVDVAPGPGHDATSPLGVMVVVYDNAAGAAEALTLPAG